MSLLIKALASAEKDKQAEQNKLQSGKPVAADLALAPIDVKPLAMSDSAVSDAVAEDIANAQLAKGATGSIFTESKQAETNSLNDSYAANYLSLAEEAGLTNAYFAASKYVKPKTGADKSSSQANDQFNQQKDNMQAAQQAKKAVEPLYDVATSRAQATQSAETNQKAAAKVFVANQSVRTSSSKSALVALGIAGALMIWLGMQGYSYFNKSTAPVLVVVKPAMPASLVPVEATVLPQAISTDNAIVKDVVKSTVESDISQNSIVADKEVPKNPQANQLKSMREESFVENETLVSISEKNSQSASKHAPVKLISHALTVGIDPTLLAAYQAFSRGEYAAAQQQYRQVLQGDIRNVDALLGMAAIAERQGRDADAQGWYEKVLEIEPRNIIAQSAIVSTQTNTDVVGTESRLKSMLAQQPEAANLHASLGNLYVEQSQWPSAQEAFFNACRFAPNNADYAFNLAISLDQMGKSNLALKQYQRALELLNKSGASSPDKTQLEARIKALQ